MPRTIPHWRSLCQLSGAPEAALVSSRCQYSLSTVEVICDSAVMFCALVEQEHSGTWRWAVYGLKDSAFADGTAATHEGARRVAMRVLVALERAGMINLHHRHSCVPLRLADTPDEAA